MSDPLTDHYQHTEADSAPAEPTHEERQFAMFCHFIAFVGVVAPVVGHIIGTLVLWQLKRHDSAYIDYHGKEALNFNITITIAALVSMVLWLVFIGILLSFAISLFWLIMVIIAGVKANDGEYYRYPLTIRLVN